MKISVIIPTYNRYWQLNEAIRSVYNQTKKPDEIIIIDDASEQKISQVDFEDFFCEEITIIFERFEIPKGACHARNRGAEIASGDILMFLDDDDTWEPNKVEAQLSIFATNIHIGLVYSGRLMASSTNRNKILYTIQPLASGNLYPQILYDNLIGTTSSVAIKKSLFTEVGGFDKELPAFQDYDLWIRCCKRTIVGHDGSCNVRYTVSANPKSQISGQSYRHIEAVHKLMDKYKKEIASQGIFQARKITAKHLFSVAKSLRNHGLIKALPWICSSFFQYPNSKVIALILPVRTIQILQNFRSKLS